MTDKEKLEKLKKLADAMYYAAFNLTTDASLLRKAMEKYHQFIIHEYCKEEPVSDELEKAANEWDTKASFTPFYMTLDDKGNPNGVRQDYTTHAESFKAGAQWDKEQMMAKAIDGYVIEDVEEGNGDFLLSADYLPKSMGLKDQQKVKVIVIREG